MPRRTNNGNPSSSVPQLTRTDKRTARARSKRAALCLPRSRFPPRAKRACTNCARRKARCERTSAKGPCINCASRDDLKHTCQPREPKRVGKSYNHRLENAIVSKKDLDMIRQKQKAARSKRARSQGRRTAKPKPSRTPTTLKKTHQPSRSFGPARLRKRKAPSSSSLHNPPSARPKRPRAVKESKGESNRKTPTPGAGQPPVHRFPGLREKRPACSELQPVRADKQTPTLSSHLSQNDRDPIMSASIPLFASLDCDDYACVGSSLGGCADENDPWFLFSNQSGPWIPTLCVYPTLCV